MIATKSSVISGTPRMNSMKPSENQRTMGMRERRPSARTMPMGSESTIPVMPATRLSMKPPNWSVVTPWRPKPPTSRKAAITG